MLAELEVNYTKNGFTFKDLYRIEFWLDCVNSLAGDKNEYDFIKGNWVVFQSNNEPYIKKELGKMLDPDIINIKGNTDNYDSDSVYLYLYYDFVGDQTITLKANLIRRLKDGKRIKT